MNLPVNVEVGLKHCDKHDIDYDCHAVKFGAKLIEQPCPECQKETKKIEAKKESEARTVENQRLIGLRFKKSGIPPRYTTRTFDNFNCKNESQLKALDMSRSYSKNISENMNTGAGLILSGKPGTGKTHLACAIGCEFASMGTVLFITVSAMIRQIRATYRKGSNQTEQDVIDFFRDIDLLIIDEIGVQKGTDSEEHLLFEVINERYSYFKPTILISNLNAEEIKAYIGERALDRMREGGGKFIAFDWGSYRGDVANDESLPDLSGAKYKSEKALGRGRV